MPGPREPFLPHLHRWLRRPQMSREPSRAVYSGCWPMSDLQTLKTNIRRTSFYGQLCIAAILDDIRFFGQKPPLLLSIVILPSSRSVASLLRIPSSKANPKVQKPSCYDYGLFSMKNCRQFYTIFPYERHGQLFFDDVMPGLCGTVSLRDTICLLFFLYVSFFVCVLPASVFLLI